MKQLMGNLIVVGLLCSLASASVGTAQTVDPSQSAWHQKYKSQPNAPKPDAMLLNTDQEPELKNGFQPMFNGTDLTGWATKGGKCSFEVKGDLVVGQNVIGSESTYLCTDRTDYKDFIFSCDMKWEVDGNSGVMFRSQIKDDKKAQTVFGPQAEMEGITGDRYWSGGIYGQSCGGYFYPLWLTQHKAARAALKRDDWNRLTIFANGNVVKTWVNGVPAAHWVDDGTYPSGFFGLQIHKGKQGTVLWKNVRIKELNKVQNESGSLDKSSSQWIDLINGQGPIGIASIGKNLIECSNVNVKPKEKKLTAVSGVGVVAALSKFEFGGNNNLSSKKQFGDCEVELEFLIGEDCNSGVKLQERYEIQIFDSHATKKPNAKECGGVYPHWVPRGDGLGLKYIDEGVPPLVNAAKPAGQWQTLKINFKAPRFDDQGQKSENARFVSVVLNDVTIQQNVEVDSPTGNADTPLPEVAQAPLFLQMDHGAVAFRNVRVKPSN